MTTAETIARPRRASDATPMPIGAWVFLLAYIGIVGVARGLYAALGIEPSGDFELLSAIAFVNAVWHWVVQECAPRGATFPLDFGWFVAGLWFALVPYYMRRYQGWRGLGKCALIALWFIFTRMFAVFLYFVVGSGN